MGEWAFAVAVLLTAASWSAWNHVAWSNGPLDVQKAHASYDVLGNEAAKETQSIQDRQAHAGASQMQACQPSKGKLILARGMHGDSGQRWHLDLG